MSSRHRKVEKVSTRRSSPPPRPKPPAPKPPARTEEVKADSKAEAPKPSAPASPAKADEKPRSSAAAPAAREVEGSSGAPASPADEKSGKVEDKASSAAPSWKVGDEFAKSQDLKAEEKGDRGLLGKRLGHQIQDWLGGGRVRRSTPDQGKAPEEEREQRAREVAQAERARFAVPDTAKPGETREVSKVGEPGRIEAPKPSDPGRSEAPKPHDPGRSEAPKPHDPGRLEVKPAERGSAAAESRKEGSGGPGAAKPAEPSAEGKRLAGPEGVGRSEAAKAADGNRTVEAKAEAPRSAEESSAEAEAAARAAASYRESQTLGTRIGGAIASALGLDPKAARQAAADHVDRPQEPGGPKAAPPATEAVRAVPEPGQSGNAETKPETRSEAVKPAEGKTPAAEAVKRAEGKAPAAEGAKPAPSLEAKPDKSKEGPRQSETLGSEIGAAMAAAFGLDRATPAASTAGQEPSGTSPLQAAGEAKAVPAPGEAKAVPAPGDAKVVAATGDAKSVPAPGDAKVVAAAGDAKVLAAAGDAKAAPAPGEAKDVPATGEAKGVSSALDAKPAPEGQDKPAEEGAASGFSLSSLLSPESLLTAATPLGGVGAAALEAGSSLLKATGIGASLGNWSKDFFSGIKGDLGKIGGPQTGPDGQMEFSRDAQVGRLTIPGMPSSEAQGVEGWFSGLSPREQARWGRRLEGYPPEDRARMAMLARRIDSSGVSDPRLRADMEWKVMEDHRLDPEFDSNMIRAYQGVILTDMQNLPAVSRRHGFGEGADGRGGVTAEQMQGVPGAYNTTNNKVLYTPSVMDEGTTRDMAASRITRGHERAHHIDDRLLTERGWESNRLHYAAASGQAFQGVSAAEVRDQKQQELARILDPVSRQGEAGRIAAHAFENRAEYMATMHSLWAEGRRNPELRDQIRQFDPTTARLLTQMEHRGLQTDRQFMSTTSFDRLEQDFGISRRDLQPFRGWRNDPDQRRRLEEYLLGRVGADNAQFAIGTLLAHSHHGQGHGNRGGHGSSNLGASTRGSGGVQPISSGGTRPVSSGGANASGGIRPYSGGGAHGSSSGMRHVDSGGSAPRAGHVSPSTGYSHSGGTHWNPQSRVDPTSQLDPLGNDPLKELRDEKAAREAERAEAQKGKQGEAPQDSVELTALDLNRDGRIELRELLEARRGGVALSADGWDAMTRLMGHLGSDPSRDSLSRVYQDATRVTPNLAAGDRSAGGRGEVRPPGPGAQGQGEADTDPRRSKEVAAAQAAPPPGAAQPTAPLVKPVAEPSQEVQLGLFREAYSVLMEGAAGKPDVKNMWLLSAIAGDRNGSHAVADAFETMLVGRKGPEQMMNLFRKVGQHTELAAAFSDTFARVAEAAPERAMGTLLLVTDHNGGRESVSGLFRDLASEPRAAVALGEMLQASTRTRGGLRGTAELLDTLSMPHNDRLTGAGELARALGDTAGWVGGSRALGKTFVNLLDAEAGGRGVATLMARMSGEPSGARATGDLLTRLGFDREGQQDLGRVLTRATGSRLGAQQFLGTLDRVASSEGGRRQVAVLFDQLSSTSMGARLLGNLAREGTGAEALGKLFDKVATSAPAGERLAWALERLGSNPRAEAEMDLFRGRAAGSERLSSAVARLAEATPGRARMSAPLAWGASSEPGPAPAPAFGGSRVPEGLRTPLEAGTLRLDTGRGLEGARTLEAGARGVDSRSGSAGVAGRADRLEAARIDLARPVEATSRLQPGRASEPASRADLPASRSALEASRADLPASRSALEASRADLPASRAGLEASRADLPASRGTGFPHGEIGSGAAREVPVMAEAWLPGAAGTSGARAASAPAADATRGSEAVRSGQPAGAAGAASPGAARSAAASFLLTMTPEALLEPGPAPAPAETGRAAVPTAGTADPARQGAVPAARATGPESVGGTAVLGRAEAVRTYAEREASAAAEPGRELARSREIGAPGPVRTSVHRSDAERVRPVDRPQEAEAAFSRALQDEAVRVERKPAFFRPADVYSEQTLLHARICGECGFRLSPSGTCARCTVSAFYR